MLAQSRAHDSVVESKDHGCPTASVAISYRSRFRTTTVKTDRHQFGADRHASESTHDWYEESSQTHIF